MKLLLTRFARWLGLAARPDFARQLDSAIERGEGVVLRVAALQRSLDDRPVAVRRFLVRSLSGNPHEE